MTAHTLHTHTRCTHNTLGTNTADHYLAVARAAEAEAALVHERTSQSALDLKKHRAHAKEV